MYTALLRPEQEEFGMHPITIRKGFDFKIIAMSENTRLYIKNMCCTSCIATVQQLLTEANYKAVSVSLGEVVIEGVIDIEGVHALDKKLATRGFAIASSLKDTTVTKIKSLLFQYLSNVLKHSERTKLSSYIVQNISHTYHYLSALFSDTEKITIEKYFILLKIEKAKELIVQNELSISDIAYALGYSSPQTFITQFKKITGKTPLMYKQDPTPPRAHLNKLNK